MNLEAEEKTMNQKYAYMNETSIDPELICNICHSPFRDPYCTPCDETFCRQCITDWIQRGNNKCPHCQQTISMPVLREAPRPFRNMLDRLLVKCILCEQTNLQRVTFDDHIMKVCPKMILSCSAADIKCPWRGERDQLKEHLAACNFEPMRTVLTNFMTENQRLKDQVNRLTNHVAELLEINLQYQQPVNQTKPQLTGSRNGFTQTIGRIGLWPTGKQQAAAALPDTVELFCGGHVCTRCKQCCDWNYINHSFTKRGDATCHRPHLGPLYVHICWCENK